MQEIILDGPEIFGTWRDTEESVHPNAISGTIAFHRGELWICNGKQDWAVINKGRIYGYVEGPFGKFTRAVVIQPERDMVERFALRQRGADSIAYKFGIPFTNRSTLPEWDKSYLQIHSEAWSSRLRKLQEETRYKEKHQVLVQPEFEDWE